MYSKKVIALFSLGFISFFSGLYAFTNGANIIDVLGQTDDNLTNPGAVLNKAGNTTNSGSNVNKFGLKGAGDVAVDTVRHRLFIADKGNNRVLVYNLNTNNTVLDRVPDFVLGQDNFYSGNEQTRSAISLNEPAGLAYDAINDRLFVSIYVSHLATGAITW